MGALADADGVDPSREDLARLDEDGFLLVEDVLDAPTAAGLARRLDALLEDEGAAAGTEFRQLVPVAERDGADHLGGLLAKDPRFRACVAAPRVLGLVRHLLGPELVVHAVNARRPRPGAGRQVLHTHLGLCSALWLLDDMTADNGPTRVLPGSHRRPPEEEGFDPAAPHPGERVIVARAGAVLVLTGEVLHGGTANDSGAPRWIVTTAFSGPGVPPQDAGAARARPAPR